MSVDYRLLDRFEASRQRNEAAWRALPRRWRSDPRPEAQIMNEHWVNVILEASDDHEQPSERPSTAPLMLLGDDR